ncbi:hypothetical protein QVD17_31402 [Tagetes erecta]|uniref:Uncharacterized protein n=1 Tax=Tagetes erecta TaxID=13708 RepID=A0AAD8K4G5_TARER|nr:hypothetical protein QVD17_31402 [Tagetes erecta]
MTTKEGMTGEIPHAQVFTTEEARYSFRPPRPLTKPVSKRDSGKFCVFHNDVGHHTNDCFQLKKRIEEAVKSGDLAHLVKEFKDKKESKKGAECNMVHTAARPFGRPRSGAWTRQSIDFPPTDPETFITTPVIIEAELDGSLIDRVYMDCGAGAEIMYERCFLQLSEETRAKLQPSETPLVGFAGERVHPLGQITLEVCLRDGNLSRVEELTFAVVRHPSHYNIIIGRSGISAFQAIVSTSHGMMKFLTEGGVATLKPTAEALLIASAEEASDAEQKQVIEVSLNASYPEQTIKVNNNLSSHILRKIIKLLQESQDVFAWCPEDMTGVPRSTSEHSLNIYPGHKPVVQKKRSLAPERSLAVDEEVEKLVQAGILREVKYHSWVANPVLVKKPNGSWRMCIDFKDLNKASPKDCYPLPEIDRKVDSLASFPYRCFLDAYKGYHQIQMKKEDEEKTAFYTDKGIFCYTKMPFGLKNAGATYQRLIDQAFAEQIGKNVEAYVDDLVIKSQTEDDIVSDMEETFRNLRKINMKLNPAKCSFGFEEGKFLGHIVDKQGIKANPSQIQAVLDMKSPQTKKQVQSLAGKIAALKRFLPKSAEKSLPFFKTLKNCVDKKDFKWTIEAEAAFQDLKKQIAFLPTITAPVAESLSLFTSQQAISAVLVVERAKVEMPIYFISRALRDSEINHTPMEKLVLALVHTSKRLRRYFQAHHIRVLTNQPIKSVLEKPENSGRLAKWAVGLGEHNIEYSPRKAIKAQILADFLSEIPEKTKEVNEVAAEEDKMPRQKSAWTLFTDGASSVEGSGAGLIITDPFGTEYTYVLRLEFPCTNNEAEYEALLAGLRIARSMKVEELEAFGDSRLVANQVNDEYTAKEPSMIKYKAKVKDLMKEFKSCTLQQVSRSKNKQADALSKLASLTFAHLTKKVLVEVQKAPSISEIEVQDIVDEVQETWMTPIINFLKEGKLPSNEAEASRLPSKAEHYVIEDNVLYKKSYLSPLLRCVGPEQSNYLIREVHEGVCGAHAGPRSVVTRLMNLGYYWPTMHKDASEEISKCEGCQLHAPVKTNPKHDLVPVMAAWPFFKWGMDIVGPFPEAAGRVKFLLVAIDYFTKWPEVKPLASITGKQVINFVWENIICRFGLPGEIVTDNGRQFAEKPFSSWCEEFKIKQVFSSVAYPQSNGQVERMNRSIVEGIKARLGRYGKNWLEELPSVLWAIRTTEKTSHLKTPYSLVYGSEAVIPAEIGVNTRRSRKRSRDDNDREILLNLDLLEEARDHALIREARYKQKLEAYYNSRVKKETFKPGDLVLRNNEASRQEGLGKLGPKWEGPYIIKESHKGGSYKLTYQEGKMVPRHWNGKHLKRFYV